MLVTACGDDPGSAPAATSPVAGCAPEVTPGSDAFEPLPIPPATVSITDAGTRPLRPAVLQPDREQIQKSILTVTSTADSATSDPADASVDNRSETVELPLTAQFGCDDAEGSPTEVELYLDRPTSPDPELDGHLDSMTGTTAGISLGATLLPSTLRLVPTEASGPEARRAVEQSLVQALGQLVGIPTEPLGTGARWRTVRTLHSAVSVTQTIEATLRSWDGDQMVIDFTVEETPINSVFSIPGTNERLTISRYSMEGSGQVTIDLRKGLPVVGQTQLGGARELVGSDDSMPIIQQTGLTVTWRSQ